MEHCQICRPEIQTPDIREGDILFLTLFYTNSVHCSHTQALKEHSKLSNRTENITNQI